MKRGVWIYFDLGINGDYESMYAWLDNHDAHACGDRFAFVRYEYNDNLFEELKDEIRNEVDLAQKDHIYVVCKEEGGNVVGKFLAGKRMKAPWVGYGFADEEEAIDES